MLHDPEAEAAANAVEDDPRTAAEKTTDAKAAGIETIEGAVNKVATETTEVNVAATEETVAATVDSEVATEETVVIDVPLTVVSVAMAATAGSEAATGEQVEMASAPDEALNAVGRQTEASVAPKGSAQVTHTTDPPEISEHLVRLNARKIEWT